MEDWEITMKHIRLLALMEVLPEIYHGVIPEHRRRDLANKCKAEMLELINELENAK